MADGRGESEWARTAAAMAQYANAHRNPKKTRPYTPADFNPYAARARKAPAPKVKGLGILKAVFVDQKGGRDG